MKISQQRLLLEFGKTQTGVAESVGGARSIFSRLWNRFQEAGNVRCLSWLGRPCATTEIDKYLKLTARRNRTNNATRLKRLKSGTF